MSPKMIDTSVSRLRDHEPSRLLVIAVMLLSPMRCQVVRKSRHVREVSAFAVGLCYSGSIIDAPVPVSTLKIRYDMLTGFGLKVQ